MYRKLFWHGVLAPLMVCPQQYLPHTCNSIKILRSHPPASPCNSFNESFDTQAWLSRMSPHVMEVKHHPTTQGSQLNQVLCHYLLNSRQAVWAILCLHENFWNSEQMPQVMRCDIEEVTNNQTNSGFPFGTDECI